MIAKKKPIWDLQTRDGSIDPVDLAVQQRDENVLSMVQDALDHGDCFLAFQPIVRAGTTGQAGFHEGFIRILDETGRIIPASEFMPAAEDTELGREIDKLALDMGCHALHTHRDLRLSVNMSARSIGFQPWMKALNWWLSKDETIGPRLILEMTEASVMLMPEVVITFMKTLQPAGICFALDDFGSGAIALRHFRDFMFDIVKIDGQFTQGIARNLDDQVLVEAMLDIAHKFDMLTVAEMVETDEDAEVLTRLGVDCLQGFLFCSPMTEPDGIPSTG